MVKGFEKLWIQMVSGQQNTNNTNNDQLPVKFYDKKTKHTGEKANI